LSANVRSKGTLPPTIVGIRKLVFLLPHSKHRMILSLFVWVQYQYVTDGRTDRQTDGRTELQCGRAVKTDEQDAQLYYIGLQKV